MSIRPIEPMMARRASCLAWRPLPTPRQLEDAGTPELMALLAHVCGILGHRLGSAKVRETLDRVGARLPGVRHG